MHAQEFWPYCVVFPTWIKHNQSPSNHSKRGQIPIPVPPTINLSGVLISLSQSIRYLSLFHQVNTKISTCHKQNSLTLQSNKHDISIRQTSVNLIPSTLQHWNLKFTCLGVIRLMKFLGKPIIKITLLASTQQKTPKMEETKKDFCPVTSTHSKTQTSKRHA